jgi:outer membrane protein insertion porin family
LFLFFNIAFVPQIAAQQLQQEDYGGFEGQQVSRVEISANPAIARESVRSLIQLKAGEPFAFSAVQASAAALQNTKLFTKVQVSVTPGQSGIEVVFILQPTSYIGVIDFPGATKAFSYPQLLQTVNIPEQTAYVGDMPEQGTQALLRFFQRNGYFEAKVVAEVQPDNPHRVVNLTFRSQLNRLARIGNLNIHGLSGEQESDVRRTLQSFWARLKGASLKPGKKYSTKRITKSLDYIRAHLQGEGRLAPLVRFDPPVFDPVTGRADLNFQVDAGPRLSVRVTGARVSGRTIRRLVPIYEENAVDQDLVDEGRRNLLSYFQSKGYFDVKVDPRMERSPEFVSVDYEIIRGSKHQVESVDFRGNQHLDDKQLQALVSVKKGHSFFGHLFSHGQFSESLIRKSVNALTAAYKDAGFADVSVTPEIADFEPRLDVTFKIAEGEQYIVKSLTFANNRTQSQRAIIGNRPLNLSPGRPYSPSLMERDRNRILARYENEGYENAQFQPTVAFDSANRHLVDVVYSIDEGPQQKIGDVAILGTQTTKKNFISEATRSNVEQEKPLSLGKLLTAESDLYNLGIFDWASVKPLQPPGEDEPQQEVLIKVHESPRNSIDIGGGFEVIPRTGNIPVGTVALPGIPPIGVGSNFTVSQNSYWGPRISLQYGRHNLRGRAETATFGLIYSRLDQRATFTYADPRLRGSSWSSLFTLSAERSSQNSIYTAEVEQGSFQVEKNLDARRVKNILLRYTYQNTVLTNITIPDLVLPEDQHVRLSTFAVQYVRDTRDKPLDAHRGSYQTASAEVSPAKLGSSASFVRFFGQASFYKPVKPWLTWANNFRLGIAKPFSGAIVPLSERYFSGGADSLRGFPVNGAGPQRPVQVCADPSNPSTCTLISVPVGGDMLAIFNSEARFPMPLKSGLGGVVFYDGGNVYSNINFRQFADEFTHTVGFGIRYQTPVGPVRIDFGHRLTSVPGVKSNEYFVTLGQSF